MFVLGKLVDDIVDLTKGICSKVKGKTIENFHLPPNSSVIALVQVRSKDSEKSSYTVTNNGSVDITLQVLHNTRVFCGNKHTSVVKPSETEVIDLDEHQHNTSLKISNSNLTETAVFSAKGGQIVKGIEDKIEQIPSASTDDLPANKIERLYLPPHSEVIALTYDGEREGDSYIVKNDGPVELEIDIIHNTKEIRVGDSHSDILKPHHSKIVELTPHYLNTILKVTNRNEAVGAYFSAEGGTPIHGVQYNIQPLPAVSEDEKVEGKVEEENTLKKVEDKIESYALLPRSQISAMSQGSSDEDPSKHENYIIKNIGSVDIDVFVTYEKDNEKGEAHRSDVKPGETKVIEFDDHYHVTTLTVMNLSYDEMAGFSAEGGKLIHNFQFLAKAVPEEYRK